MRIGLDMSIWRPSGGIGDGEIAPPPPPPGSDPNVLAIQSDGWRATYQAPGTFDPVGDPNRVLVQRPGFDSAGSPATIDDTVTIMARVRQPYPNEATLTSEDVSLSEFVYSGDTVDGISNQSTRVYPKPQALWLNHDLETATTSTHRVRLAVAHAHAQQGRPVAAVRFIASDGTNTTETLVTEMDTISYPATGLSVPHFAGDLDFSGLDTGVLITVDAEIRPWIGTPFLLSTDADPYPSVNLTVLKVLNDRAGDYATSYVYVDADTGNDSTGLASTDAVAARAAPYATLLGAIGGIYNHNVNVQGRTSVSGGRIRLEPGVHTHQSVAWFPVTEVPIVIEAADPAQKAATIYQDAGVSISNGLPDKVIYRNLTLRRNATGNVIFLDSQALNGVENMLVVDGCTWDSNGLGAPWNPWIYRVGRFWLINCDGEDLGQCRQFSTDFKAVISIGSGSGSLQDLTYHAVACRDLNAQVETNPVAGNLQVPRGDFFGWNHFAQGDTQFGYKAYFTSKERGIDDRGLAIVGNVFERLNTDAYPVVSISADGVELPALNVNYMCNTVVGARTNLLYNDSGSASVSKEGRCRFNVDQLWNSKDDTFLPPDGGRVGNWSVQYRVGFHTNAVLNGSNKGTDFGAGDIWLGEIAAFGDVSGSVASPIASDWADDQSFNTAGSGDGDYRPGAGHALPEIPAGLAPYAFDQRGQAVADDGSAVVGAIQA